MKVAQMREMPKLGWLIGLVKHEKWGDSFYFLRLLFLSIPKIPASAHFTGLILIFLENPH
jgi:hypothetical protein